MQSMTGYGQARVKGRGYTLAVEVQSHNHRFLEVKVKMPPEYLSLEREVIELVSSRIARGWITVIVSLRLSPERAEMRVNRKLARKYWNGIQKLRRELAISQPFNPEILVQLPGVFEISSGQPGTRELKADLISALDSALERMIRLRAREGRALSSVMKRHLKSLRTSLRQTRSLIPDPARAANEKRGRNDNDTAGRYNVEEELNRLESHLEHLGKTLERKQPIGKILEFILREILREVTTLGDKAGLAAVSDRAVLMKTEIENLREQSRNVE